MKATISMGLVTAMLAGSALWSGCGGAPADGVTTPNGLPPVSDDVMGKPHDGTGRGDGTGVSPSDHDPVTPHDDKPEPAPSAPK